MKKFRNLQQELVPIAGKIIVPSRLCPIIKFTKNRDMTRVLISLSYAQLMKNNLTKNIPHLQSIVHRPWLSQV